MKACRAMLGLMLGWAGLPAIAGGPSLVDPQHYTSLYADHKAAGAGDLVTVLVVEAASAESEAIASGDRSFNLSGNVVHNDHTPNVGLDVDHTVSGEGKTSRTGTIRAQVSARVEQVLDTGDLFLRGEQNITINGEQQKLTVEGVARPWDITADNAVLSTRLLNPKIQFIGQGWVNDSQRPSVFERIARFFGL